MSYDPDPSKTTHQIQPGQRARLEKAIVDGQWQTYYVCLKCMGKHLSQWGASQATEEVSDLVIG